MQNSTQEGPVNQENTDSFLWGKSANYCTIVLPDAIALINPGKVLFIYLTTYQVTGDLKGQSFIFQKEFGIRG